MATVLITGGAGFLGSHLADAYAALGHRVIIVDHFQREKLRFLPPSAEVHRYAFADPRVRDVLRAAMPDIVFHLAAQISVVKSVAHPDEEVRANVLASAQFFLWCAEAHVKKIVFASSGGAIYAGFNHIPTPLVYDLHPLSPYGLAKQACEYYLQGIFREYGIPFVALRFANLYGPRQQVAKPLGEGNVLSLFLDKLLVTGEPFTVYGDGSTTRDYVYVDDAVRALMLACEKDFCGIVNVGSGKETSLATLLEALFAVHGKAHPVQYAPVRDGEVLRSALDATSAHGALGWFPRVDFAQGVAQTYDWYRTTFAS